MIWVHKFKLLKPQLINEILNSNLFSVRIEHNNLNNQFDIDIFKHTLK